MNNSWQIKVSGKASARQNMAWDTEDLMNLTPTSSPSLRFYAWENHCATYGYFLQPYDYLNSKKLEEMGLEIAQRPTGGGIIFHLYDLAFSVIIPAHHSAYSINTLDNYHYINKKVIEAIQLTSGKQLHLHMLEAECESPCFQFCMAKPTKFDVMMKGKKIGGAAQRRTKQGFLHQSSISLRQLSDEFLDVILLSEEAKKAMKTNSYSLLPFSATREEMENYKKELINNVKLLICN